MRNPIRAKLAIPYAGRGESFSVGIELDQAASFVPTNQAAAIDFGAPVGKGASGCASERPKRNSASRSQQGRKL